MSDDPIAAVAERWPRKAWKAGEAETWRAKAAKHPPERWCAALDRALEERAQAADPERRTMCPDLFEVEQALKALAGGRYATANEREPDPEASGPVTPPDEGLELVRSLRGALAGRG